MNARKRVSGNLAAQQMGTSSPEREFITQNTMQTKSVHEWYEMELKVKLWKVPPSWILA